MEKLETRAVLLTAGEYRYENYLSFTDSHSEVEMSEEFKEACRTLGEHKPRNLNTAAIRWYQSRAKTFQPVVPVTLTKVQQAQIDRAAAFVRSIGFAEDFDRYPITVVNWLGEGIYGQAKDGQILVSKECFDKGTKYLASTLLEEFVHNRYGLSDESRSLQNWLFDRIITMGEEHVTGEPL